MNIPPQLINHLFKNEVANADLDCDGNGTYNSEEWASALADYEETFGTLSSDVKKVLTTHILIANTDHVHPDTKQRLNCPPPNYLGLGMGCPPPLNPKAEISKEKLDLFLANANKATDTPAAPTHSIKDKVVATLARTTLRMLTKK